MTSTQNHTLSGLFFDPINDALEFLDKLTGEIYQAKSQGPFSSSIGAHMRHILDHYHALMLGIDAGRVDYNQRTRESATETDMGLAKESWLQIKEWLSSFSEDSLRRTFEVITEHGSVHSSMGRELSFVSSHAVHHFAFMKQLSSQFNISLSNDVGVAPATLKNIRETAANN